MVRTIVSATSRTKNRDVRLGNQNALDVHKVEMPALPSLATPHDVISAGCQVGGVAVAKLLGRKVGRKDKTKYRERGLVRLRAACAWIMREGFRDGDRPFMSLPEIARQLGYNDHTTVLYHLRTTCLRPKTQELVQEMVKEMWRMRPSAAGGAAGDAA